MSNDGRIPTLVSSANGLAAAWEHSLMLLDACGCEIRTEYDAKDDDGNYVDPPSLDCTMMLVVERPSSEPFIHRAFPGGLEDLEEYRQEVVDGIKDHWVRDGSDHEDKRWEYTYHGRLTKYATFKPAYEVSGFDLSKGVGNVMPEFCLIDQLDEMVKKLAASPISRRVQAITWDVASDLACYDPPCLQSIWCRILPDDNDVWHLNMNVRFRSRDAYDAAFMNCFAFICLQEELAKRISEKAGREVRLGHYCDISDSYHIYGRRRQHFKDCFLKQVFERSFAERTWTREDAAPFFEAAKPEIAAKVARKDAQDAR